MMGKSCVDVLRDVTGDNSIQTIPEGLQAALSGGSGGGLLITVTNTHESATMNKTFSEVKTALESGNQVVCLWSDDEYTTHQRYIVTGCKCALSDEVNTYSVFVMYGTSTETFDATDVDGYPELNW